MKIIMTIIGARPQIIKAAAISRAFNNYYSHQIQELIVHTGQHYDENMSAVFFEELGIPKPFAQLSIGSSSHGHQSGMMLVELEQLMQEHKPDAVIIYGDTNSTLSGALAAAKIGIPVIHIEAGLRSYNKSMPEEINRIVADNVSTILYSPTKQGIENLKKEGFTVDFAYTDGSTATASLDAPLVFHCGDIMYDNSLFFSEKASQQSTVLTNLSIENESFILATIHRNTNTDDPIRLAALFEGLLEISIEHEIAVVLPLHPRTKKFLYQTAPQSLLDILNNSTQIHLIDPVGFLDMIHLEKNATLVVTDSGGVQKEAYFFKKPCVVLREETEWVELVETGAAKLAGADKSKLKTAVSEFLMNPPTAFPPIFGDGQASEFICKTLIDKLFLVEKSI